MRRLLYIIIGILMVMHVNAQASLGQGVIAIFPMVTKRDSCQIRIVEIYRDQEAYKSHIASAHFQTYKQGTLHMVKSLDLVDMNAMNPAAMSAIFRKMEK